MERLAIEVVWNLPYRPEYNGIEEGWALMKAYYRKELLRKLLTGEILDMMSLVTNSIKNVKPEHLQACARNAIRLMRSTEF